MAGCSTLQLKITVAVLVLCSCSISANIQNPGGCSPAPPNDSLISSGSPGVLRSNNVPNILTSTGSKRVTLFRPVIGGHSTDPWAVFSETQVRQHGLWCQVQEANTNNMTDSNIGDWYYPTPNGFSLLPNMSNDGTPYQSLKCGNQVGLVVDGDIMNNQGIVRCTTYITGLTTLTLLNTDTNYLGVYEDSVITNIRDSGPVVDSTITLQLLHTRDVGPNVQFRLSFNVSHGLPSRIKCTRDSTQIRAGRGFVPGVNYEVFRPLYVNHSKPEIIRVSLEETRSRNSAVYCCTVYVEGRKNIVSGEYNFDLLGIGTSTVTIAVVGPPTNVTATRNGYNSVLVSWTAPSPAPGGYEVFHQTTSDADRFSVGNTTSTMMTVTGLTLGVRYYIFVVSFGVEGAPVLPSAHSKPAAEVSLSILALQLCGTPTLTPNTTSIMVSWTHPHIFPDNYTISYSCQLLCDSLTPSVHTNTVTGQGKASNYTIFSLNAGSSCTVSVTAVFVDGNSNTITSSTNTLIAAPTSAPRGLISTSVDSRSQSLEWRTVPCPHHGGRPITGYRLRFGNGTSIVNTTGEENRQHVLTGLTPFTSYSVQVAAVNDKGTGPYSDPALTIETLQDVPGPVSGLSATLGIVQLTISWNPPSESNGVIIAYEVCTNSSGVFSYTNTSATQHTLRDLPPNTVVTFSVRAYTIIGPGEYVTGQASTKGMVTSVINETFTETTIATSACQSIQRCTMTPLLYTTMSTSTGLAGLVIGWILFAVTLFGCGISNAFFIVSLRHSSRKYSKYLSKKSLTTREDIYENPDVNASVNQEIYDNPDLTQMEQISMKECAAYTTHRNDCTEDEYESIPAMQQ